MYIPDFEKNEIILGIYISLPSCYGEYIRNYRIEHGDGCAALCPSHITLLPPTVFHRLDLPKIMEHLEDITSTYKPFWIKLDGVASFKPVSNVSYIKVVSGADECKELHDKVLNSEFIDSSSERFSFHPHVTIAHDVSDSSFSVLENEFSDFNSAFICSKICVDLLDTDGSSTNIAVLPLKNLSN